MTSSLECNSRPLVESLTYLNTYVNTEKYRFILQILILELFNGESTDIDVDAQYPKFNTNIRVFPVFYSISILRFKPLIFSCYLTLLTL